MGNLGTAQLHIPFPPHLSQIYTKSVYFSYDPPSFIKEFKGTLSF